MNKAPRSKAPSTAVPFNNLDDMGDQFKHLLQLRLNYLDAAAAFISLNPEIARIVRDGKEFITEERNRMRGR